MVRYEGVNKVYERIFIRDGDRLRPLAESFPVRLSIRGEVKLHTIYMVYRDKSYTIYLEKNGEIKQIGKDPDTLTGSLKKEFGENYEIPQAVKKPRYKKGDILELESGREVLFEDKHGKITVVDYGESITIRRGDEPRIICVEVKDDVILGNAILRKGINHLQISLTDKGLMFGRSWIKGLDTQIDAFVYEGDVPLKVEGDNSVIAKFKDKVVISKESDPIEVSVSVIGNPEFGNVILSKGENVLELTFDGFRTSKKTEIEAIIYTGDVVLTEGDSVVGHFGTDKFYLRKGKEACNISVTINGDVSIGNAKLNKGLNEIKIEFTQDGRLMFGVTEKSRYTLPKLEDIIEGHEVLAEENAQFLENAKNCKTLEEYNKLIKDSNRGTVNFKIVGKVYNNVATVHIQSDYYGRKVKGTLFYTFTDGEVRVIDIAGYIAYKGTISEDEKDKTKLQAPIPGVLGSSVEVIAYEKGLYLLRGITQKTLEDGKIIFRGGIHVVNDVIVPFGIHADIFVYEGVTFKGITTGKGGARFTVQEDGTPARKSGAIAYIRSGNITYKVIDSAESEGILMARLDKFMPLPKGFVAIDRNGAGHKALSKTNMIAFTDNGIFGIFKVKNLREFDNTATGQKSDMVDLNKAVKDMWSVGMVVDKNGRHLVSGDIVMAVKMLADEKNGLYIPKRSEVSLLLDTASPKNDVKMLISVEDRKIKPEQNTNGFKPLNEDLHKKLQNCDKKAFNELPEEELFFVIGGKEYSVVRLDIESAYGTETLKGEFYYAFIDGKAQVISIGNDIAYKSHAPPAQKGSGQEQALPDITGSKYDVIRKIEVEGETIYHLRGIVRVDPFTEKKTLFGGIYVKNGNITLIGIGADIGLHQVEFKVITNKKGILRITILKDGSPALKSFEKGAALESIEINGIPYKVKSTTPQNGSLVLEVDKNLPIDFETTDKKNTPHNMKDNTKTLAFTKDGLFAVFQKKFTAVKPFDYTFSEQDQAASEAEGVAVKPVDLNNVIKDMHSKGIVDIQDGRFLVSGDSIIVAVRLAFNDEKGFYIKDKSDVNLLLNTEKRDLEIKVSTKAAEFSFKNLPKYITKQGNYIRIPSNKGLELFKVERKNEQEDFTMSTILIAPANEDIEIEIEKKKGGKEFIFADQHYQLPSGTRIKYVIDNRKTKKPKKQEEYAAAFSSGAYLGIKNGVGGVNGFIRLLKGQKKATIPILVSAGDRIMRKTKEASGEAEPFRGTTQAYMKDHPDLASVKLLVINQDIQDCIDASVTNLWVGPIGQAQIAIQNSMAVTLPGSHVYFDEEGYTADDITFTSGGAIITPFGMLLDKGTKANGRPVKNFIFIDEADEDYNYTVIDATIKGKRESFEFDGTKWIAKSKPEDYTVEGTVKSKFKGIDNLITMKIKEKLRVDDKGNWLIQCYDGRIVNKSEGGKPTELPDAMNKKLLFASPSELKDKRYQIVDATQEGANLEFWVTDNGALILLHTGSELTFKGHVFMGKTEHIGTGDKGLTISIVRTKQGIGYKYERGNGRIDFHDSKGTFINYREITPLNNEDYDEDHIVVEQHDGSSLNWHGWKFWETLGNLAYTGAHLSTNSTPRYSYTLYSIDKTGKRSFMGHSLCSVSLEKVWIRKIKAEIEGKTIVIPIMDFVSANKHDIDSFVPIDKCDIAALFRRNALLAGIDQDAYVTVKNEFGLDKMYTFKVHTSLGKGKIKPVRHEVRSTAISNIEKIKTGYKKTIITRYKNKAFKNKESFEYDEDFNEIPEKRTCSTLTPYYDAKKQKTVMVETNIFKSTPKVTIKSKLLLASYIMLFGESSKKVISYHEPFLESLSMVGTSIGYGFWRSNTRIFVHLNKACDYFGWDLGFLKKYFRDVDYDLLEAEAFAFKETSEHFSIQWRENIRPLPDFIEQGAAFALGAVEGISQGMLLPVHVIAHPVETGVGFADLLETLPEQLLSDPGRTIGSFWGFTIGMSLWSPAMFKMGEAGRGKGVKLITERVQTPRMAVKRFARAQIKRMSGLAVMFAVSKLLGDMGEVVGYGFGDEKGAVIGKATGGLTAFFGMPHIGRAKAAFKTARLRRSQLRIEKFLVQSKKAKSNGDTKLAQQLKLKAQKEMVNISEFLSRSEKKVNLLYLKAEQCFLDGNPKRAGQLVLEARIRIIKRAGLKFKKHAKAIRLFIEAEEARLSKNNTKVRALRLKAVNEILHISRFKRGSREIILDLIKAEELRLDGHKTRAEKLEAKAKAEKLEAKAWKRQMPKAGTLSSFLQM
ncbi:MAG: hypothetical protein KJ706_10205 [Candidatus Omnitrophica bacterium]|nr:hypothetical protein [Candidatus Omnitrophota bacterium]